MKKLAAVMEYVKLAFALLVMGYLAYLFTFYLDGDIGVVICSFLIIAPLLSVLLTFRARKHVTASLEAPDYLAKGRRFTARLTLKADGRLPIPFLRVQLRQSANLTAADGRMVQSAMVSSAPLEVPAELTANYAGCGFLEIGELAVSDYLGLFRFSVKDLPERLRIGVIPAIPSLTGAGVILHAVSDAVLTQDEEEEESAAAVSAQSMPGYIHREYIPGDSLRRINWKMSAKRQKLMVRMDEAVSAVRPALMLDLQPEEIPAALRLRERMMEGALGLLMLLVRQGVPCSVRFADQGQWKSLMLESEDAVRAAAVELATADLTSGHRLDPAAVHERAGAYLVYTTRPDSDLDAQLAAMRDQGYVACVFPQEMAPVLAGADAMWQLADDYAMTALQK